MGLWDRSRRIGAIEGAGKQPDMTFQAAGDRDAGDDAG